MNGLVLAGGKSTRMGTDKSVMQWHGTEQRYYMADLLRGLCNEVYISCRADQAEQIDKQYPVMVDTYSGLGPFGAILSAMTAHKDTAWLVTACDLPLLDAATLQYLLHNRDADTIATTFKSPFDGLPEPLVTIWEPKSLPLLLAFLSEGRSCPRKVLIRNEQQVKILNPPDPNALMNANTEDEARQARALLNL